MITDFYKGGNLLEYIEKEKFLSEEKAAIIMKQILSAVFYCHSYGIIHRDLKLENILFLKANDIHTIKVIDFGVSCFSQNKLQKARMGSVNLSFHFK